MSAGIILEQLETTASYQAHDLTGIDLANTNLAAANFAGFNLTNAIFKGATLFGANLSGADARGTAGLDLTQPATAYLIQPNGHIAGLDLNAGKTLIVRDYDGNPVLSLEPVPIMVDQHFAVGPGGTLRMVFEADAWDSTISFAAGLPVTLGGTLDLTFAEGTNLTSQVGRTFQLFDWTGVAPTGAFNIASSYTWNLSKLYSSGEITLTAVPEPSSLALAAMCIFGFVLSLRRSVYRASRLSTVVVIAVCAAPHAPRP